MTFGTAIDRWKYQRPFESLLQATEILTALFRPDTEQIAQIWVLDKELANINHFLDTELQKLAEHSDEDVLSKACVQLEQVREDFAARKFGRNCEGIYTEALHALERLLDLFYIFSGKHEAEAVARVWCLFVKYPGKTGHIRKLYASARVFGENRFADNLGKELRTEIDRAAKFIFTYLHRNGLKEIYTADKFAFRFDIDGYEPFDGASIGLGAAIVTLAAFLDLDVPPDVAVTGRLGPETDSCSIRLHPVDGLKQKLQAATANGKHAIVSRGENPDGSLQNVTALGTLEDAFQEVWGSDFGDLLKKGINQRNKPRYLQEEYEEIKLCYDRHNRDDAEGIIKAVNLFCEKIEAFPDHLRLQTCGLKARHLQMWSLLHQGKAAAALQAFYDRIQPMAENDTFVKQDAERIFEQTAILSSAYAMAITDLYNFDRGLSILTAWESTIRTERPHDSCARFYGTLGLLNTLSGRYEDAVQALLAGIEAARKMNACDPVSRNERADQLYRKHVYLAQALTRMSRQSDALQYLGKAASHLHDAERCNGESPEEKQERNTYFLAYAWCEYNLALGLQTSNRSALERVVAQAESWKHIPDYPSILLVRDKGRALCVLNDPSGALASFRESLVTAPDLSGEVIETLRWTSRLEIVRLFLQCDEVESAEKEIRSLLATINETQTRIAFQPFTDHFMKNMVMPLNQALTDLETLSNGFQDTEKLIIQALTAVPY